MLRAEYIRLKAQIAVLKEVSLNYQGKTIDNVILQLKAIADEVEEKKQA
jgi:hypothetical protein